MLSLVSVSLKAAKTDSKELAEEFEKKKIGFKKKIEEIEKTCKRKKRENKKKKIILESQPKAQKESKESATEKD